MFRRVLFSTAFAVLLLGAWGPECRAQQGGVCGWYAQTWAPGGSFMGEYRYGGTQSEATNNANMYRRMGYRVGTLAPKNCVSETWYRVRMYELDRRWDSYSRRWVPYWRYAGAFENPDYGRVLRYAQSWKEISPSRRTYGRIEQFRR